MVETIFVSDTGLICSSSVRYSCAVRETCAASFNYRCPQGALLLCSSPSQAIVARIERGSIGAGRTIYDPFRELVRIAWTLAFADGRGRDAALSRFLLR